MEIVKKRRSGIIDVMRAVAILSVVYAHCIVIKAEPESVYSYYEQVCTNIGTIGVGIFYFVSGYCYHPKKHAFASMLATKLRKIIAPWVIIGIPLWRYCIPTYEGSAVKSLVLFLLGYQSILYYLTNLIIYFVVFYGVELIPNRIAKKGVCLILCFLSWISIIVESNGISPFPTLYLNPFNFVFYFSLGFLLQQLPERMEAVKKWANNYLWILAFLLLFTPMKFSYTENALTPIFEILFILSAYNTGRLFEKIKWICEIGKSSLFIYLIHIPIVGYSYVVFTIIPYGKFLQVIRPEAVLMISFVVVYLFKQSTKLFKEKAGSSLISTKGKR